MDEMTGITALERRVGYLDEELLGWRRSGYYRRRWWWHPPWRERWWT